MHPLIRSILSVTCLAFLVGSGWAAEPWMGPRPPTAEEQAAFEAGATRLTSVQPNQLALARVRGEAAALTKRGIPAIRSKTWPVLPATVDNSLLPSFPPIGNQASQGSCASYATTYYMLTHQTALARGWNAKTGGDAFRYSPKLTYNVINGGMDTGSSAYGAINVFWNHGGLTLTEWPYDSDFRAWPCTSALWRSAMTSRIAAYGTISRINEPAGFEMLKQMLANGNVLAFGTNDPGIEWKFRTMFGTRIVYANIVGGGRGGHVMTVVGYDDTVWCDVNGNGSEDAGERGVLKIANQWGDNDTWNMNGGYYYVSYDAVRSQSLVAGFTPVNRAPTFNSALWITARADYQPAAIAEFTLRHRYRNALFVALDRGPSGVAVPDGPSRLLGLLGRNGGPYAFDGTTTARDATFAVDLDLLGLGAIDGRRIFLDCSNATSGVESGHILDFRITRPDGSAIAAAVGLPQDIAVGATVRTWVDATWGTVGGPIITIAATGGTASEAGQTSASLRISKPTSVGNLTVNLSHTGSANQGIDYFLRTTSGAMVGSTVVIPDGSGWLDLTLVPIDDVIDEGTETALIGIASGSGYQIGSPATASIGITDDDALQIQLPWSGITIINVPEGGTARLPIRLSAAPTGSVTVTAGGFSGDSDLGAQAPGSVTFGPGDWNQWKDIVFTAAQDADATQGSCSAVLSSPGMSDSSINMIEIEDETARVIATPYATMVSEGGSALVSLRLSAAPAADVLYSIEADGGDADLTLTGPATVTFTTSNWNIVQTVQFSAAIDADMLVGSAEFSIHTVSWSDYVGIHLVEVEPGLNVAPVVAAVITNQTGTVSTAFTYSVPAGTFTDADGDTLTWSASGLPAGLSFTAGTRVIAGTPTTAGVSTVTVSVNDGHAHTTSTTFTITINAANVAPVVAAAILNQTGTVSTSFTYTVPAGTFTDADGDTLTWSASGLPAGLSFTAGTRIIAGTPTTAGTSTVTVSVNDGHAHTTTTTFTITINAANVAPVASAQSVSTREDTITLLLLAGIDSDGTIGSYAYHQPTHGVVTGTGANVTYVPQLNFFGADSFTFTVTDNLGLESSPATISVTVTAVNDAPLFTKGADKTVLMDAPAQSISGWATAISAGPANEAAQTLTFTVTNTNTALFSVQPAIAANGTLTFTPAAGQTGIATVTVTLMDDGGTANGGIDTSPAQTCIITVTQTNLPVVINSQSACGFGSGFSLFLVLISLALTMTFKSRRKRY